MSGKHVRSSDPLPSGAWPRHAKPKLHPADRGRVRQMFIVLIVGLLVSGMSVGAASAGPQPFAVGGGRAFAAGRSYVQFAFAAHDHLHDASGHITLNWPPASGQPSSAHGQMLAHVTCLVVNGNTATAYGRVTKSVNPDVPFRPDWVGIYVTDHPNTFYGFFGVGNPPCDNEPHGPVPFYSGNVVISS